MAEQLGATEGSSMLLPATVSANSVMIGEFSCPFVPIHRAVPIPWTVPIPRRVTVTGDNEDEDVIGVTEGLSSMLLSATVSANSVMIGEFSCPFVPIHRAVPIPWPVPIPRWVTVTGDNEDEDVIGVTEGLSSMLFPATVSGDYVMIGTFCCPFVPIPCPVPIPSPVTVTSDNEDNDVVLDDQEAEPPAIICQEEPPVIINQEEPHPPHEGFIVIPVIPLESLHYPPPPPAFIDQLPVYRVPQPPPPPINNPLLLPAVVFFPPETPPFVIIGGVIYGRLPPVGM